MGKNGSARHEACEVAAATPRSVRRRVLSTRDACSQQTLASARTHPAGPSLHLSNGRLLTHTAEGPRNGNKPFHRSRACVCERVSASDCVMLVWRAHFFLSFKRQNTFIQRLRILFSFTFCGVFVQSYVRYNTITRRCCEPKRARARAREGEP